MEWARENLPVRLCPVSADYLDRGMVYMHGRDKNLRTLIVMQPRVLAELKDDAD